MLRTAWLVSLLVSSPNAFGFSETQFPKEYESVIAPYLARHATDGAFHETGARLSYRKVEPASAVGTAVIVPGAAESYLLYGELMYDFAQAGLRVYALDPRGQGLSRSQGDMSPLLNIDTFETHVSDLEAFVEKVVKADGSQPLLVFGGSSGGVVAGLFAARNPTLVKRLALSSPLMELRLSVGVQNSAASFAFLSGQILLGKALQAAPVSHFSLESWEAADSPMTSSVSRRTLVSKVLRSSEGLPRAGVTNLWAKSLADAAFRLESEAYKIKSPVLVFQPGSDAIARKRPQASLCLRIARCVLIKIQGAKHKVFFEEDALRQPALDHLLRFFDVQKVLSAESMAQGASQTL
ncbi:MAG: alpha/beta hydrolase [Silvanigrellales bacterium]|nr:alpha/beta hydrolase [Silvanigrellales bacterium]